MNKKIVKLMTGTNISNGDQLLQKKFKNFSSWSDNLETVAHYYEGRVIEITIELILDEQREHIRDAEDLELLNIKPEEYTYGFAEMRYPKNAIWYSFSKKYLDDHVIDIREIFPDLSEFDE